MTSGALGMIDRFFYPITLESFILAVLLRKLCKKVMSLWMFLWSFDESSTINCKEIPINHHMTDLFRFLLDWFTSKVRIKNRPETCN